MLTKNAKVNNDSQNNANTAQLECLIHIDRSFNVIYKMQN